jgi:hypothetical protein
MKGRYSDRWLCFVDGVSVIESTHSSNEVYLVPDIVTKLSAGSTSSSVCAETGAPDICHDVSNIGSPTTTTNDEEEQSPLKNDVRSTVHDDRCPRHLQSTLKHGRNGCEIVLKHSNDDDDDDRPDEDDVPYFISLSSVKIEQTPHNGSTEVSSISLSDAFSIDQQMFDFSQRLMQDFTPRRRQRPEALFNKNLSITATTPSRYQRPVDSLLISHKHPSPIKTNAIWRKQVHENERPSVNCFGYENVDPQSPRMARRDDDIYGLSESKRYFGLEKELNESRAPLSPRGTRRQGDMKEHLSESERSFGLEKEMNVSRAPLSPSTAQT